MGKSKKTVSKKKHFSINIIEYKIILPLLLFIALPLILFNSQKKQENLNVHAAAISPSGQAMPVGDLPGWKQVFTDDFTTDVPLGSFPSSVSAKWSAYPDGWKDTSKNGTYYPSKVVSIQNGVMNLYLHTENGVHMVAAPVPVIPGATGSEGGLQYGRYAIRFKADSLPCYKTAWLLWPDSEVWPRDGEIDFPEGNLDGTINAYMHWMNGTSGNDQDAYATTSTYSSWHTAVIEWNPVQTNFILDGVTIGSSTSNIPSTPMHWVIQTETGLNGCVPSNTTAGNVQIDWVAAYAYAPGLQPTATPTPTPTPTATPTPTPTTTPVVTQLIQNGTFENGIAPWGVTVRSPAVASLTTTTSMKADGNYSGQVTISKNASTTWYIQLTQANLALVQGKTYTISFWAKSSKNRQIENLIQQQGGSYTGYADDVFSLTTSWKKYSYTFHAPVSITAAFIFNLAQSTGTVWFDDISMVSN